MQVTSVSKVFGALADPTRMAIVARLAQGEATVKELTEPFDLTQQAVSLHLKMLESAGLRDTPEGRQIAPARLEVDRLVEAIGWVDDRRQEWLERHQRLATHLANLQDAER